MKKFSFLLFLFLTSCKFSSDYTPARIEGKQLQITDSIPADESLSEFIQPYKENIDREMNQVLSYSSFDLTKRDGELNTAIGNMMADAVMELSNPVFKSRTGNSIDIVLLNHGGIRSSISKGPVTTRTAYQVMPFENEVVVAKMNGKYVRQMVHYLIDAGTAHPVSGLKLEIGKDNSIKKVLIKGQPLEDNKDYYVATNDYLLNGGDNMVFFSNASEVTDLDYKIRNLLMDYFKQQDTIAPVRDYRFIRIN
ncbi:5'-nucleotidase, C-terminal domain [Salinimicrobium sediminis]|uniref:5'-nucleotidase, C-terminal domain n=1 Tax=Salinimicrobium sediminis TaxID=1343891 RepID=A0A285X847_9FLAO|nr:5'-nucleotidase [Salinimicrobium sediminis]SOC80599.1 5'-nucleotidase, C-terminal domain [Salinimicrobium sediminis]